MYCIQERKIAGMYSDPKAGGCKNAMLCGSCIFRVRAERSISDGQNAGDLNEHRTSAYIYGRPLRLNWTRTLSLV